MGLAQLRFNCFSTIQEGLCVWGKRLNIHIACTLCLSGSCYFKQCELLSEEEGVRAKKVTTQLGKITRST